MAITIKCFAVIKDLVGKEEVLIELEDLEKPDVQSLWNTLERRFEGLKGKQNYVRFSKNLQFVESDTVLEDGDEIGIIPPVAGG